MSQPEMNELGPGGRASFVALAGTLIFLFGIVLGPIGLFFMALGVFVVLASPVFWLLMVWDSRSDE